MKLTIKQLKDKIKDLDDNSLVYIERIEDIYFEKYNWKTEKIIFQKDKNGNIIESSEIFIASQANKYNNNLIIYTHY